MAGDVDVNSKFAVTASDGCWRSRRTCSRWPAHGRHGGGGDPGRGGRRGREQWDVCGDCIGRVTGDPDKQVHGGRRHGQHGGGGDAERDGATTLSSTLDVAGDVDVNSKFAVTASDGSLAIATNMFTVAGGTRRHGGGGDPGRGGRRGRDSGMFAVTASDGAGDRDEHVHGGRRHGAGGGGDAERGSATLSSTLDVAGDVDVNSKFATASDGCWRSRRTCSRWPAARATRWWRGPWTWRATWT